MPRPFPLQAVLDLARQRTEAAAARVSVQSARRAEAEQKRELLARYHADYWERMQRSQRSGVSMAMLRDFQAFVAKLEFAIRQQEEDVARAHAAWQAAQDEWLEMRRKQQALEVLEARHLTSELERDARREQREQDEFAGRIRGPSESSR